MQDSRGLGTTPRPDFGNSWQRTNVILQLLQIGIRGIAIEIEISPIRTHDRRRLLSPLNIWKQKSKEFDDDASNETTSQTIGSR